MEALIGEMAWEDESGPRVWIRLSAFTPEELIQNELPGKIVRDFETLIPLPKPPLKRQ